MSKRTASSTVAVALALVVAGVATGGVAVAQLTPDGAVADDGGPGLAAQNATQNETAEIRAVHASPDAPNVDVYFDNESVLTDVSFGTVSDYLEVSAGEHTFTVTAAGNRSAVVYNDTITLDAGERYSAVAFGEVTEDAATAFNVTLFEDAAVEAAEGNATVRVVHLSPDAPPVDVVVNDTDTVVAENVSFGNASDYASVAAGDYTLDVRPAGENETVATFDASLESGVAYSAFAVGYLEPETAPADEAFEVVVAEDVTPEDGNVTETPEEGIVTETPEEGMVTETPEEGMVTETPTEGNVTSVGGT